MAISVDPMTHVITVPQADLTPIGGVFYELDVNDLRLWLKAWEDNQDYAICMLKTHDHNTEVTLSGITYARIVEILDPYTIEFEDGQYVVNCTGANHNLADVKVANQVSIIVNNAAGLIVYTSGSGVTAQDKLDIADAVWDEAVAGHITADTFGGEVAMEDNATVNAAAIITQIDANETKIDAIQADLDNPNQYKADVSGLDTKLDAIQADLDNPSQYKADVSGLALSTDMAYLKKIVGNKKSLVKTGSVWELIIYDDDNITPILQKDLKDKDGNDITDLDAGILAQELKTSV